MIFLQNFFLSFVFTFFFWLRGGDFSGHDIPSSSVGYNQLLFTGVTQTYQSNKSIKSYFPLVITVLLAKTLYYVLIYAHPGPSVS